MVNTRENDIVRIYASDNNIEHGDLIMGVDTTVTPNVAKFLRLDADGNLVVSTSSGGAATSYTERIAYNASNQTEYLGKAVPGSLDSAAVWQIKKLTYSGNLVTEIKFADGNANFDNIWDNRASLSYS